MKNNFDLEDYRLIQDTKENYLKNYVVLILIIIGIFILLYKFEFQVYEKQTLIKDNDNYLLIASSSEIAYYENQRFIFINKQKYTYDIVKVDNDYSNIDNVIYQSIYIKPHNYKTNAIITECYFLRSESTILQEVFKFIQGGLG